MLADRRVGIIFDPEASCGERQVSGRNLRIGGRQGNDGSPKRERRVARIGTGPVA